MWHKYGWFWDEKTKSWYQCTPIDDPQRGYGCEYNGTWYPMKKSEPSMQKQPQTMPVIKEAVKEDEEDVIAPEEAGDGEEAIVEESYAS
jgi:hypothetical protein